LYIWFRNKLIPLMVYKLCGVPYKSRYRK